MSRASRRRAAFQIVAAIVFAPSAAAPFSAAQAQLPAINPPTNASAPLEITPTPDFVVEHDYPSLDELQFDPIQGARMLLLDRQHDATLDEPAYYTRYVSQAATYSGVVNVSQLPIPYDPAYQRFEVHHVRVIRDGVVEDRGERTHLDVLRREQFLEQQMLTGALTANLRLDDIRVGDMVDIAFTIYGAPASFEGRDVRGFDLGFQMPVERAALRSRWPRDVRWEARGLTPEIMEMRERDSMLLELEPQPIEALEPEPFVPIWEPLFPVLVASDFGDWADVARWGEPYYDVAPDEEVTALAQSIAAEHASKAEQVVAALRFVQQEVRYFATVLGEGGYVPAPVNETLASRTGDCKAKTLLLLALMDALGVEARPALVNTSVGRILPELPPSPSSFDHVLARVTVDGERYWLDPSSIFQGGDLARLHQPDHGYALPLGPGSGELVRMEETTYDAPTLVVRQDFDASPGAAQPTTMRYDLVYTGADANEMRALYAVYAKTEIEKASIEGFDAEYDGADLQSESRVTDALDLNRFEVSYDFILADPWTDADGEGRRFLNFDAFGIVAPVPNVGDEERVWPLVLIHQQRVRHEVTAHLPDLPSWDIAPEDDLIENDAFRFTRTIRFEGTTLTYVAELEVLADAIPAEAVASVLEDQDEMIEMLSYHVWTPANARAMLPDLALPDIAVDIRP